MKNKHRVMLSNEDLTMIHDGLAILRPGDYQTEIRLSRLGCRISRLIPDEPTTPPKLALEPEAEPTPAIKPITGIRILSWDDIKPRTTT